MNTIQKRPELTQLSKASSPPELIPKGLEKCFLNKTYFVEQTGHFSLPHGLENRLSSALECQERCRKTYLCEHFSFWTSGGCLLTSYSAYPRKYDGPAGANVISGPRECKVAPPDPMYALPAAANVPPYMPKEAHGHCGGLHDEYKLTWRAEGETFFDDWQFIETSMTRGAEWYLNRSEAFFHSVAHASSAGAILRVGEQVHPFKRRSLMLRSPQAWRPDSGFMVAMKYKHVPYGPGIWPAYWLVNSDLPWPKGGELDVLEYANDQTAKVTFHTDFNCSLEVNKMKTCAREMIDVDDEMIPSCFTNYSGNELGCLPNQVRKTGEWYSKNPGVLAVLWDASGIIVYHIPQAEIPEDLKNDKPEPNKWPGRWRFAYMPFDPSGCVNVARPQEIVLNIALCGDWAGNAWWDCEECKQTGFVPNYCIPAHVTEPATDCCTIYMSNPSAEENLKTKAYFDIDYIKVFQPKNSNMPKYASGTYRNGGEAK